MQQQEAYPVRFAVDYPDRPLHRLTTAFGIFAWVLTTGRYPPFRLSQ